MNSISLKKYRYLIVLGVILLFCFTLTSFSRPVTTSNYDIVVVGSDPEGIIAAATASSYDKKVLLIDTRSKPGGLYTSGMLTMLDLNYIDSTNSSFVNGGSFKSLYDNIGINSSIDINATSEYFTNLLSNCGVITIYDAYNIKPIIKEVTNANEVTGITYSRDGIDYTVHSNLTIDCTPDAPIARASGVSYHLGREDINSSSYAAATLVFGLNNVDWQKVCSHINADKSMYTGFTKNTAWGYPEMLAYQPQLSDRFQVRALNLSLQSNGEVIVNGFQIFDVNSVDKTSQFMDYSLAKNEVSYIADYMRNNLEGFENATIGNIADELYIREGVRIVGLDTLTGEDGFDNTNFDNKIAYGSYPMDLQSTKRDLSGGTILSARNIYTIPLGVIIPKEVGGLLVSSRSSSYDSIIHSSCRTVPVGIAVAEGTGVVAAYCVTNDKTPREVYLNQQDTKNIQKELVNRGVNLDLPLNVSHPEKNHWSYPSIVSLRKQALLSKEYFYKNDYHTDATATVYDINKIINLIKVNTDLPINAIPQYSKDEVISIDNLTDILNSSLNINLATLKDFANKGIISEASLNKCLSSNRLVSGHIYMVMDDVVNFLRSFETPSNKTNSNIVHYDL